MIIRQGMSVALVGVVIGVASAYGLTRVLASFLFGVTARDPIVFISVPVVLSILEPGGHDAGDHVRSSPAHALNDL